MRKLELHPVERAMSDGNPFQGNWVERLYERVRERGYDSLTAFAEARPTLPLVELAQELGGGELNEWEWVREQPGQGRERGGPPRPLPVLAGKAPEAGRPPGVMLLSVVAGSSLLLGMLLGALLLSG
jgi:hypothetical protein